MRGLPGTGKTTRALELKEKFDAVHCSADHYFERDGEYKFNINHIHLAHCSCKHKFMKAIESGAKSIIVDNTNTQWKEFKYYVNVGVESGYKIYIVYPDTQISLMIDIYSKCPTTGNRTRIINQLSKITNRIGGFSRKMPIRTLEAMLDRFEYINGYEYED
jgi:tRNA uridine 5-carbamoylmethylation protein Kti12